MLKWLQWRERALVAEAQVAAANETLDGLDLRIANRAILVSITREGRYVRFLFTRNGELHTVRCMGTWDDDIEGWKRDLFE